MTFEEFIPKWYEEHPLVKTIKNEEDFGFETDILQRIDWIKYCVVSNQEVDVVFYDNLFNKLLVLLTTDVYEGRDILLGYFIDFINTIPENGYKGRSRDYYDSLLVVTVAQLLLKDIPFKNQMKLFLTWARNRNRFLVEVGLGWPSSETGYLTAFYIRNRSSFLNIRNTDFGTMKEIANYYLALYNSCKTMDRKMMAGDIIKVHDRVLDFMRDVLASARINGYDDYEKDIKEIIDDLKAEVSDTPSVFISYTWSDSKIVDKIEESIQKFAIVHRDSHDLKTGDSLRNFMKSIRNQDFVILIVSDRYLQRRNCMYEVLQLLRDYDENKKNSFWSKVIVFVTASGVYDIKGKVKKVQYWVDICNQTEKMIATLPEYAKEGLVEESKTLRFISMEINKLLDHISDAINQEDLDTFIIEMQEKLKKWAQYGSNPYYDVVLAMMQTKEKESS